MPWFTAAVTGRQSRRWLIASTIAFIVLMAFNLVQPLGMQLARIDRIETKVMPWGETYANAVGQLAPTFWFAVSADAGDSRRLRGPVLVELAPAQVRHQHADDVEHGGVPGREHRRHSGSRAHDRLHAPGRIRVFLAMVIAMSLTLSYRSRQILDGFRAALPGAGGAVTVWHSGSGHRWRNCPGQPGMGTALGQERIAESCASRTSACCRSSSVPFSATRARRVPRPRKVGSGFAPSCTRSKDPNGLVRNVIVMHEDVTEEKRAEDAARAVTAELSQVKHAVLQQERLRALGQMAGGIAHDINNAISPAAMYVEAMLEQDQTLNARARERLSIVQQAIAAVVQTVARLREFCRPREVASDARGRGSQRCGSAIRRADARALANHGAGKGHCHSDGTGPGGWTAHHQRQRERNPRCRSST